MKKLVKHALFGDEDRCIQNQSLTETTVSYTTTGATTPTVSYTTTAPATQVNFRPIDVQHVEKAPVIQEVIKPGVVEEIQPVIHREREQLEIKEELQPIYETTVQPTIVEQRQLAPEVRPDIRLGNLPVIAEGPRSSTVIQDTQVNTVVRPPIVEETVHKKIIEEIQPVIHRETIAPKVIQERKDIYEKILEPPTVTYTALPAQYSLDPMNRSGTVPSRLVRNDTPIPTLTTPPPNFLGQQTKTYQETTIVEKNANSFLAQ